MKSYLTLKKGPLFYHIKLVGGNNKIRLSGETYVRHPNATRAILKLSKDLNLPIR